MPDRLRVASYNTRDFLDDAPLAARVVRAIDPDVLCLQEVPRRLLARRRLARFARGCGLRTTGSHRGSGGTTILVSARVRLLDAAHHRLPVRWPDRTRGFARVRVRLAGGTCLTVACVHLSLRPAERAEHVRTLLAELAGAEPLVVAGDLNEGPGGTAWRRLVEEGGLRQVAPDGPTYPAATPRHTLDVVLASPGVAVRSRREVLLPEAVWARASDHRPVWADLEVG